MKRTSILTLALLGLQAITAHAGNSTWYPVRDTHPISVVNDKTPDTYTWEFYSTYQEPTTEELSQLESTHRLGNKVAYLYDAFKDIYVKKEEVVPGDPTRRTIIRKPAIYQAVRTIEKGLNKAVKKNEIQETDAEAQLAQVLKIALAAVDSDTVTFEDALQKQKEDTQALLTIFSAVKLNAMY